METEFHISINQLAEFSGASLASKRRIIKNQKKVDRFLIWWYQGAKAAIRRHLANAKNYQPIKEEIERQKIRETDGNKNKEIDKRVSIEALEKYITLKLPPILAGLKYEVVKPLTKRVVIEGVDVGVLPEVIIKAEIDGQTVYGGVKIHICKGKPFDYHQCRVSAEILYRFIKTKVVKDDEIVLPNFCLCIDIFAGRIVPAGKISTDELAFVLSELKSLWKKAA